MTFERNGRNPAQIKGVIKLLIPEAYLKKEENPREHVLKAYKGTAAKFQQLDLKGKGAREIQSMDEIFHGPLKELSELDATSIKTAKRKWSCKGVAGKLTGDSSVFHDRNAYPQ